MSFWSEAIEVVNPYKLINPDDIKKSGETNISDKKNNKKILKKKSKCRVKKFYK